MTSNRKSLETFGNKSGLHLFRILIAFISWMLLSTKIYILDNDSTIQLDPDYNVFTRGGHHLFKMYLYHESVQNRNFIWLFNKIIKNVWSLYLHTYTLKFYSLFFNLNITCVLKWYIFKIIIIIYLYNSFIFLNQSPQD